MLLTFDVKRICYLIYNEYNEEGVLIENFTSFNVQFTALQASIQARAVSILSDIFTFSKIVMMMALFLSLIVTAVLIPAYYFIQMRTENILKLFATLQPVQILQILVSI